MAYLSPAASRTQGIYFDYMADQFHTRFSFIDGANGANSPWSNYDTEYAFSGRFEFLAQGTWEQFADFTSPQGSEQGMLFGIGALSQTAEYGTTANNEMQIFVVSADASLEFDGWNLFGSFTWNSWDDDALNDMDWYGFVFQGGYYFTETLEGFARYEYNDFDTTGVEDLSLLTVGVNAYYTENVKMTADVGYGLDTVSNATDITGWRNDTGTEDGQFVFRTQLQLIF